MPRPRTAVKPKLAESVGIVDLHFHGAFGVDLMHAEQPDLERLSALLWQSGIAAFCPTTLSEPWPELKAAVARLGDWIRTRDPKTPGAIPLGIHLEGPFIHPQASGAHPPQGLTRFSLERLEELWQASGKTLKLITLAPELLSPSKLKRLCRWARTNAVVLSIGHSRATEAQSRTAFAAGFSGVTHAWNAMPFQQREPGVLGAALGRPGVHVELIIDQAHVSPTLIRWTEALHPEGLCFVSDALPAAHLPAGKWQSFGSLRVCCTRGACRLSNGALAGGSLLLPEALGQWALARAGSRDSREIARALKRVLPQATRFPLQALGLDARILSRKRIGWTLQSSRKLIATPLDSG